MIFPGRLSGLAAAAGIAAALAFAGPSVAATRVEGVDLLVLLDGGRQTGALQACTGEQCRLDGKTVARGGIAWVGLGTGDVRPPAGAVATEDEVHLHDGSVIKGPVVGISLGLVATESESYERDRVRWVRFAGTMTVVTEDLLLLAGGAHQLGALQACDGTGCTLDSERFARERVRWVGLATGAAAPPAPQDLAKGEVRRADGEVAAGELVGIDDQRVVTDRATYSRGEVVWVYLPPQRPPPAGGPYGAPPGERGGGAPDEQPQPPPPPPPPRPDAPPPPGAAPAGPCGRPVPHGFAAEDGGRWIGRMDGRVHTGAGHLVNTNIEVRLREARYRWKGQPMAGLVEYSDLCDDSSLVTRTHSTLRSHSGTCTYSGAGTSSVTGTVGQIMRKALSVGPGGNVSWSEDTYVLSMGPDESIPYTASCDDGRRTYGVGERPGGWNLTTEPREQLTLTGGRMAGHLAENIADFTSWSICREGSSCPPPREPGPPGQEPPANDPCGNLAAQQALLDLVDLQRQPISAELDRVMAEFDREWQAVEDLRPEFEAMARDCELWDNAELMIGLSFAAGGAAAVGSTARAIEGLDKLLDVIGFFQNGTPGWLIEIDRDPVSDILIDEAWAAVFAEMQRGSDSELAALSQQFDACPGTGLTLDSTVEDARSFLRHYAAAEALMPRWQELLKRLFHKDLERWNKWHDLYRRCLEWAACKGLDPATACTPPPAAP